MGLCWAWLLLALLASRAAAASSYVGGGYSIGSRQFNNALDLSSAAGGRTLRLLYTLLANGTLTGALVADIRSSGVYAGLSFGTPHRSSSKTVILTQAFVDGYSLNGYSVSTCNAGRGAWRLAGRSVETDPASGLLVGYFTGSGVASGRQAIGFVFGPYSGGVLGDHTRGGYPYGSIVGTLSVSVGAPSGSQPSASPPPASQPAPDDDPADLAGAQAPSLSRWVSQTVAQDSGLMVAFVVSWLAAPGVALLVWPFIFDALMDVVAGVRSVTGRCGRVHCSPAAPSVAELGQR